MKLNLSKYSHFLILTTALFLFVGFKKGTNGKVLKVKKPTTKVLDKKQAPLKEPVQVEEISSVPELVPDSISDSIPDSILDESIEKIDAKTEEQGSINLLSKMDHFKKYVKIEANGGGQFDHKAFEYYHGQTSTLVEPLSEAPSSDWIEVSSTSSGSGGKWGTTEDCFSMRAKENSRKDFCVPSGLSLKEEFVDNTAVDVDKITGINGETGVSNKLSFRPNRKFQFLSRGLSRSDLAVDIYDLADSRGSRSVKSRLVFFPRYLLPTIREVGENFEVILPNKETVAFNQKTMAITGGVFSQNALKSSAGAKGAGVKYTGNGVLVRIDGTPGVNLVTFPDEDQPNKKTTVVVSKKGHKDCNVPIYDIWDNNSEVHGQEKFLNSTFSTDKGADEFIKKKCGFSIY